MEMKEIYNKLTDIKYQLQELLFTENAENEEIVKPELEKYETEIFKEYFRIMISIERIQNDIEKLEN